MSYVIKRGPLFYFNLRLPAAIDSKRPSIRFSLGTSNRRHATMLASQLAWKLEQTTLTGPQSLEGIRKDVRAWLSEIAEEQSRLETPIPTISIAKTRCSPHKGQSLTSLVQAYIKEGTANGIWRETTRREVERALELATKLTGDIAAESFDKTTARSLRETLSRCPRYFGSKECFAGQDIAEVVRTNHSFPAITPTTVHNILRKVSAFFAWAVSEGYLEANPLEGIKVVKQNPKAARHSFEEQDLLTLLEPDILANESTRYPWRFWLPLLGRYTGARLEELCQLTVQDVQKVQGVDCLRIDDRTEGQQLKNQSSRRYVPLHPKLVQLGFLDYVNKITIAGHDRVFPELRPVRGKYGHGASKWFGKYKTKKGIIDSKKTYHSFRHTFIDELRDNEIADSIIKRLVGHEDSAVTFKVYGSRVPINALKKAIYKLS